MEAAMTTVLVQAFWPLVALCQALLLCYGFIRWLGRETTTVAALKAELAELTREWTHKFESNDKAHDERIRAIERTVNAKLGANPLGSHYDTRRPG
jgi:hypothetical protein